MTIRPRPTFPALALLSALMIPGLGCSNGEGSNATDALHTDASEDVNACVPGVMECDAGMKCQPYVRAGGDPCCVNADTCVPIEGNKQVGEACERHRLGDDCGKDLFCFAGTSGKEGPGVCRQLCDGVNPDSCADKGLPEATCISFNQGKLPMCEIECHPLRPACPAGQGCYWSGAQYTCTSPDPGPGEGDDGAACHTIQSCNPGLICALAQVLEDCPSEMCCSPYCDLAGLDGNVCTGAEVCTPLHDLDALDTDPLWLDIGVCSLPGSTAFRRAAPPRPPSSRLRPVEEHLTRPPPSRATASGPASSDRLVSREGIPLR
ncbi:MAG: hypothetical protein B7733_08815 [Myxococcales bacterium FL481]|nr:MAG: hypothetical protein B7733_08815 [Myxococcales bacterium FL481]